jgi:hypothetical protein
LYRIKGKSGRVFERKRKKRIEKENENNNAKRRVYKAERNIGRIQGRKKVKLN